MGKTGLKSTHFLMPAWTQLTIATSASCHLPSASPRLVCPLGTELHGSALAYSHAWSSRLLWKCSMLRGLPSPALSGSPEGPTGWTVFKVAGRSHSLVKAAPVPGTPGGWWSREGGCPRPGTSVGSWSRTAYSIMLHWLATPKGFYASAIW